MKSIEDAYGKQFLAQYRSQSSNVEIIERDDGYIENGSEPGLYFLEYKHWPALERHAIQRARGRVLDIGCGAGRHSLYLQSTGMDVTGMDNSPGAVQVCRQRGLKKVFTRSILDLSRFKSGSFDSILMLGNNFGLLGSQKKAKRILRELDRITSPIARIIAGTRNPYLTDDPDHLAYHRWNKQRGRMPGQIRLRIRFRKSISPWFDYLFVSPGEMETLLDGTPWMIEEYLNAGEPNYFAILRKRSRHLGK